MKKYSKPFKALWIGEIISEFAGAAGGIINGLLLYELTGSKEWMGALWLIYFIPSLILQGISAPFLNHVVKEKMLRNIQLIRAGAYLLPLASYILGTDLGIILGLIVLQSLLGLMQPIYASLSFSLLPDICKEEELVEANGLLDGTIRLMSFIAPGATSLFLLVSPVHFIYGFSSAMFFVSYLALSRIPQSSTKRVATWTKKFWWAEMKEGYRTFFKYPRLMRLTILSSTVQFAVGATLVLSVPFIRGDLDGHSWEYAIFSSAFPVGYAIGMVLLTKLPKTYQTMYLGLIGGGLSFVLLFFVNSIPFAWMCELFGGMLFPLFNAQSAAIFQREAPRNRLTQLSAVRLLFLRVTMPLGILFASSSFFDLSTRQTYAIVGIVIVLPGLLCLFASASQPENNLLEKKKQKTS
ncbi:MFS transporter [Peribacillus cavernae]|uniref:MFS transporter n=1 Tax=Peribacillus cavernae TaxID=1674310 RepID=A0A3S0W205_9BACI|nr:MFS transporter [Peribacillus cavernae]MDQ0218778.1 MFS family permease [Peribacillus cavernae]RUQ30989.1 MFS transporter [Peribacillus cavernae]